MRNLLFCVLVCAMNALCVSGCSKPTPPGPDATYTVRGKIFQLPEGGRSLEVHHEAIPSFTDKTGAVIGMKEMTMPFHDLAPGVGFEGFKPGDPVELTFEVRWKTDPRTLVTRVAKLKGDVRLNLKGEPAEPEAPKAPGAP